MKRFQTVVHAPPMVHWYSSGGAWKTVTLQAADVHTCAEKQKTKHNTQQQLQL